MKTLFAIADQYIQESDWKVIAALKLCLISMGVWLGSFLTGKWKKPVRFLCAVCFWVTYIPLMAMLLRTAFRYFRRSEE